MSTKSATDSLADIDYLALIESAPVAVVMIDGDGRIALANQQAEALFGWTRSDLLGKPIESLVPKHARHRHPDLRAGFMQRPEPRAMGPGRALHALHKSGIEFPVEIGLRPIRRPEGTFVLSTIVDISERRRTERATARLAAIVESARVAMIAYTVDGFITDWNRAAERLYGFSADEMIGRSVLSVTPPDRHHEALAIIDRVRDGESVDSLETERLLKTGRTIRVSLTISPIRAPDGSIIGISSIGHDITQRAALESQLREANENLAERTERLATQARQLQEANLALEHSNQELQEFAYVASHDLQAPLRSVNGFLHLLRDEYADELDSQGREWIERALDSVEKLQTLIRDLLSYARVESRGNPFGPVELSAVFDDVTELLTQEIVETKAQVTRDELPTIFGDSTQLASVLENLIDNALKYRSERPPVIHVGATDEQDHWRISVRDNGIGIGPQYHDQIFEVFRRLHSEGSYPGTGIGLALCRRVVQRHGGRIWLESSPGEGSIFFFTLPKA